MNPLFSIAIPAYKNTFLKECIESILSQTYTTFEIVIVNDASPFDLDAVVNSFNDERIHYYKNETNCGAINVVDNWNKCLDKVSGDYLICMGDDDMLLPNCLEDYARLIEKYPGLGVYHAWTILIDEKSAFKNITASRIEYESVYSLIWHRWNGRTAQFIGDFLFNVKTLREHGGFYKLPYAWASDDISAAIASIPHGVANTQTPCFCYRVNSQTITKTGDISVKMKAILDEISWYGEFLEKEPEDELDKKYWICLKQQFDMHFDKKKGLTIAGDLKGHVLTNSFKWLWKRKEYGVSLKVLAYAVGQSLK